jgi:YD repeat-containing protein
MKRIARLKMIIVILVIYTSSWGQYPRAGTGDYTKIIDVLPPSPNAASLGKYGGVDLSLASGTINYNIPIYNYTSINLKIPLSLSYSSNGFRVDELSGRVGTGWSLNAGGVITRTVYGSPDEIAPRVSPPADFPTRTRALVNFMKNLASNEPYPPDGQPDLFSFNFNGYTGRFILDNNLNPILLTHSNLKIESGFTSSSSLTFKITTGDGVQYFFGGDSATDFSRNIQAGEGCGRLYDTNVSTAWYLKKITHPNNDTVTFTYLPSYLMYYPIGVNQSMYNRGSQDYTSTPCFYYDVNPPTLNNTSCETSISCSSSYLQEINSTSGTKVRFNYTNRNDCDDKLLSSLEIVQPGESNPFKIFTLTYQYSHSTGFQNSYTLGDAKLNAHPFLTRLTEQSSDGLLTKTHTFSYDDINGLPPRLSFAQDHYGFFNGKDNSTLIPHPISKSWQLKFPSATANRDVDPVYCQKGLLSAITYPTGGKDSIVYEGNQVYQQVALYSPQASVNATSTNITIGGGGTPTYSASIAIGFNQDIQLMGSCISNSTDGGDALHDQARISIINAADNSEVFAQTLIPGGNLNTIVSLTQGNSYKLQVTSYGDNVTADAWFSYIPGNVTYQYMNVNTGGVRVAKVITSDKTTNTPIIKKYLYSRLSNPDISSAGQVFMYPVYEKELKVYMRCMDGTLKTGADPNNLNIDCGIAAFGYSNMSSSTLNNLYVFPSSIVSYGSVIESFGENFENGGIEHQFTVNKDVPADQLIGGTITSTPLTSYAWKNAREIYQYVFKKVGDNYIPVKKIFTSYKEDPRIDQEIKAFLASKKYDVICENTIPSDDEINAFDLFTFSYFRKWVYVDTVRTWTYDDKGQSYVELLSISEYSNPAHALPTKQTTYSSDGKTNTVIYSYPQDIKLTGSAETARQGLVSNYILSPVLQQQVNKSNSSLFTVKTDYDAFGTNMFLPRSQYLQMGNNPIEKRVDYTNYNNYGKILEQSKTNDVKHAYIWGYNNIYPIAEVVNASVKDIFYTSFEDVEGNSTDGDSKTGRKSKIDGYQKILSNISNGQYLLSYWQKSGSAWTLQTSTVTVSSGTYTISLSGQIDEVRFYPSTAQMITYTYDPLIGMTSQSDANNRITSYEYDALGRFFLVRDNDNNILKMYCYNYSGQPEACSMDKTPRWQSTGLTRCKPCPANSNYFTNIQQHQEKDNNVNSTTYNSLRWIDDGIISSCVPQPDWQNTTTPVRCQIGREGNTGDQEQEQMDINPCSSTYNTLRWVTIGQNCTACPIPANWQPTGNTRCVKDANNANTGYQEREEKDLQTCSSTYNSLRWVANGYNTTACPLPAIYARIELTDVFNDVEETKATVLIKFYSDAACTIPYSVANLSVNYNSTRNYCYGEGDPFSLDATINCSGTQYSLGTQIIYREDGLHCWNYEYKIISGSGYVAK